MVDTKLQSICEDFGAEIEAIRSSGNNEFIDITGGELKSSLTVQYVNERISIVYFYDAQYYDVSDDMLYSIVRSILAGQYTMEKKGVVKKRIVPIVTVQGYKVYPDAFR